MKRPGGFPTGIIADVALIVAALATVALTWGNRRNGRIVTAPAPEAPANWRDEIPSGIRWGTAHAPLTIIEFMDLQCPYCGRWAMRVDSLLEMYPDAVQVVWHHYPLSSHELAVPAAIAVECASQQGVAREFQMVVFAKQKMLGTMPWADLASDAGVVDIDQFGRCILQPVDSFPRIKYGLELGKRVGVRGTPTVWVNGVVDRPTLERMRGMVEQPPAGSR